MSFPFPSRIYRDRQEFSTSREWPNDSTDSNSSDSNQLALLDDALDFHPFTHYLEILTTQREPPAPPPGFLEQQYQVLLSGSVFRDEAVIDDLLSPTTRFVSLSPIDTGNGMFVRNGTITFSLNESTYQRFGIQGKSHEGTHFAVITREQSNKLRHIQECEPIEGILVTENIALYERHVKKSRQIQNKIDGWSDMLILQGDDNFSIEAAINSGDENWRNHLTNAINEYLVTGRNIFGAANRIAIEGFFDAKMTKDWINSIGDEQWTIVMLWDMKDVPGIAVGAAKGMHGVGGGCEAVFYGKGLRRAVRYQTVSFLCDE
jgi:hypothetical protein